MSNPPATSSFEHWVRTVTSLLAAYICKNRHLADVTDEELRNILTETLWEAREDIIRQPELRVPWLERLGAFWDIYSADVRASQTILSMLALTWFEITVVSPLFMLSNFTLVHNGAVWVATLVVRWARCLWTHHQQSTALMATLQDGAQQQLPGLTDDEAESMAMKITLLALVAALLGVNRGVNV